MTDPLLHVLFICTGNSARSIMAEALMNTLGRGRFRAFSAGSRPGGVVHPLALATLTTLAVPVDGLRSKSWDEFAAPGAPKLDFVLTVCDAAAGEVCPVWPGQPISAHWGVPDAASFVGTEAQKSKLFFDVALTLKRRIELMLALPMQSLDKLSLAHAVKDIGRH
ncbi:arsenate reductase ArsC [Ideonella sp. A 288]|uniref:arsenate reductase ArsC n=1 Tax=Ideonella sp. A 288 TaxID=1962181 RepID=UPI000B4BEFF4|nr:arsenate reductase ArsC [Ideonella sp. A 288]